MSALKSSKVQVGISTNPNNNFVIDASQADGTLKISRGNIGATTQTVLEIPATEGSVQRVLVRPSKIASGPLVEFSPLDGTGIPPWAKEINISFTELSTSGTFNPVVQLGNVTYKVTGYAGTQVLLTGGVGAGNLSVGFQLGGSGATAVRNGSFVLTNQGPNNWVCLGTSGSSDSPGVAVCSGYVSLSSTMDRLRIYAGGVDVFDSGSISLLIKG